MCVTAVGDPQKDHHQIKVAFLTGINLNCFDCAVRLEANFQSEKSTKRRKKDIRIL